MQYDVEGYLYLETVSFCATKPMYLPLSGVENFLLEIFGLRGWGIRYYVCHVRNDRQLLLVNFVTPVMIPQS